MSTFSTASGLDVSELIKNAEKILERIKAHEPLVVEFRANVKGWKMLQKHIQTTHISDSASLLQGIPVVLEHSLERWMLPTVEVVWRFQLKDECEIKF